MPEAKGAAAPSDSLLENIDAADLVQLRVSLVSLAAQEQEEDGGAARTGDHARMTRPQTAPRRNWVMDAGNPWKSPRPNKSLQLSAWRSSRNRSCRRGKSRCADFDSGRQLNSLLCVAWHVLTPLSATEKMVLYCRRRGG